MTTPANNLTGIAPSNAKAIVGLIGSLLTIVGPWTLTASTSLPQPWPGVIGIVFAALTTLGIYKAPYVKESQVLAPNTREVAAAAAEAPPLPPSGGFTNPWK
jgi:hypothetical protein